MVVLDSGDSLFGRSGWTGPENSEHGALLLEAMSVMGYDAMALGAIDLAPLPAMTTYLEKAGFPVLAANVGLDGALPHTQPYLLQQVAGHIVAVIGVMEQPIEPDMAAYEVGFTLADPVAAIRHTMQEVQEQADIIILLGNLAPETGTSLAQEISGIDAIIGVSEGEVTRAATIDGPDGMVILQASGVQGEYLGVLSLHIDADGRVESFAGQALPLTADRYADDPKVVEVIHKYAVQSQQ